MPPPLTDMSAKNVTFFGRLPFAALNYKQFMPIQIEDPFCLVSLVKIKLFLNTNLNKTPSFVKQLIFLQVEYDKADFLYVLCIGVVK